VLEVYGERVLWEDGGVAEEEVEGVYPPRIYLSVLRVEGEGICLK